MCHHSSKELGGIGTFDFEIRIELVFANLNASNTNNSRNKKHQMVQDQNSPIAPTFKLHNGHKYDNALKQSH